MGKNKSSPQLLPLEKQTRSEIKNKLATDIYKGQQEIEAGEFNAS